MTVKLNMNAKLNMNMKLNMKILEVSALWLPE